LQALIDCNAITIEGYSLLGGWQNMTPYTDACCWRGTFGKDDCPGSELFCTSGECIGSGNLNFGFNTTFYYQCLREVWIWRDFYSTRWANQNLILDCNDQLGCSYFILVRTIDTANSVWYQQNRFTVDGVTPDWLEGCPISCSAAPCEFSTGNPSVRCAYFTFGTDWWQIRHFRTLPNGSVTFGNDDYDPCDAEFMRCVPDQVPGFPELGKIAHFGTTQRCCVFFPNSSAISCDNSRVGVTGGCDVLLVNPLCGPQYSIPVVCFDKPSPWSIEIGTCE
jgi:hypothetical protein